MSKLNRNKSKRRNISLEESHDEKLAAYIKENDLNVSKVIELALTHYFEQKEKEKAWLKLVPIK
jgi:hypothetical protein